MKRLGGVIGCILFCWGASAAEPPVVGAGAVTLRDIAGTSTLVTVVIQDTGAEDRNLQIVDVGPDYISVISPGGERNAYAFSAIKEVRVQDGKVMAKEFRVDENRALTPEEERIFSRAVERAQAIFAGSDSNQAVKQDVAVLLAVNGDTQSLEYLRQLAASNDVATMLEAGLRLYMAGDRDSALPVVKPGLGSGNRRLKGMAAELAGLLGDRSSESQLLDMVQDRAVELSAPAARALSRLGNREAIPALLTMITDLNELRAEAAVDALVRLGGTDVAESLKQKLDRESGQTRYRIARVLYALGDPMGKSLLRDEFLTMPTLTKETAIVLAEGGDPAALQKLREILKERFSPTTENLAFRAKAAATLVKANERWAISILSDQLRTGSPELQAAVCLQAGLTGKRTLMPILAPNMESTDSTIALRACQAAMMLVKSDFRKRVSEVAI